DASPTPPPLAQPSPIQPALRALSGATLRTRAEQALTAYLASEDPVAGDRRLPPLPLLSRLTPDRLAAFIDELELRELAADARLLEQGEEGSEAFILARGVLKAVRETDGAEQLLAVLGAGAIVGEMALVSDAPRAASV